MHNSDYLFCFHPFNSLTVSRTGDAYACCADWLPAPLGNVLRTPLMEIWRGREATRLRVSVLDQSFRFCRATCPYLANPRGPVVRGVRPRSPPDFSRVGELKLSYDPTCNLRCASCRTGAVGASELTGRIHAEVAREDVLSHVGHLYASTYGDPVASPYYWSLLRGLSSLSAGSDLAVHLHTNGLLLGPRKWAELGREASRVRVVTVSVDAARESTYRLNRGGDWGRLRENLLFLSALPGVRLHLNFVVQDNNFGEMVEFMEVASGYSASQVFFAGLRNWDAVLPSSTRNLHPVFTDLEYQERAVHLPSHPRHGKLLEVLRDPVFRDPRVVLGDFLS